MRVWRDLRVEGENGEPEIGRKACGVREQKCGLGSLCGTCSLDVRACLEQVSLMN